MKGVLLWTERPILLEREKETHEWMERNRPWEQFDLELRHDNAPGDWTHYASAFAAAWRRSLELGVDLYNVESDVVPTAEAFQTLIDCREYVCTVPYRIHQYRDGVSIGYSAVIEERCPGGWYSHFATPDDRWAVLCDLGFVKYSSALIRALNPEEFPPLSSDSELLHEKMALWTRQRGRLGEKVVHLHWPALKNNHRWWDAGDDAHHPEDQLERIREGHLRDGFVSQPTP